MLSERYVIPGAEPLGSSAKVVYFIQAGDNGPIKIGYCNKLAGVWTRIADLQTGCPWPLKVRSVMPAAGIRTERDLHERFAACRMSGEWFAAIPELAELAGGEPMDAEGITSHRLLAAARKAGYDEGWGDGEWDAHLRVRKRLEEYAATLAPDVDLEVMVRKNVRTEMGLAA